MLSISASTNLPVTGNPTSLPPSPSKSFGRDDLQALSHLLDRILQNDCRLDGSSVVGAHSTGGRPLHRSVVGSSDLGHPYVCLRSLEAQANLVGSLQDSLNAIFTHYRTVWCSSGQCGIYKLPNEVLSSIFKLCIAEAGDEPSYLYAKPITHPRLRAALILAGVSRIFRDVALNTSFLWSNVYVELRPPVVDALLLRAPEAPLTVSIGPNLVHPRVKSFFQQVLPHAQRWGMLTLDLQEPGDAKSFVDALRDARAPLTRLTRLSLSSGICRPGPDTMVYAQDFFQYITEDTESSDSGSIATALVPASTLPLTPTPMQTLRQCSIALFHPSLRLWDLEWLVSKLSLFGSLQELVIQIQVYPQHLSSPGSPSPSPRSTRSAIYEFPELLSLSIHVSPAARSITPFIGSIRAPQLQTLRITLRVRNHPDYESILDEVALSVQAANITFQDLRHFNLLFMTQRSLMEPQLRIRPQLFPKAFLQMMPALEELIIEGDAVKPPYVDELRAANYLDDESVPCLDFPFLKRASFTGMPHIDAGYITAFINLLKGRADLPFPCAGIEKFGVEKLRIRRCSKVGEKEAEELRRVIGKERLVWEPAEQGPEWLGMLQPRQLANLGGLMAQPIQVNMLGVPLAGEAEAHFAGLHGPGGLAPVAQN